MNKIHSREHVCCFIGHRKIQDTPQLRKQLNQLLRELIDQQGFQTFLFGSKSKFNDLCYQLVTEYKKHAPHIQRIYVRAEFPYIDARYRDYLLQLYEDSYYPESILHAGRSVYVQRNQHMIAHSSFCVFYWDGQQTIPKSGTQAAVEYAKAKKIPWINLYSSQ